MSSARRTEGRPVPRRARDFVSSAYQQQRIFAHAENDLFLTDELQVVLRPECIVAERCALLYPGPAALITVREVAAECQNADRARGTMQLQEKPLQRDGTIFVTTQTLVHCRCETAQSVFAAAQRIKITLRRKKLQRIAAGRCEAEPQQHCKADSARTSAGCAAKNCRKVLLLPGGIELLNGEESGVILRGSAEVALNAFRQPEFFFQEFAARHRSFELLVFDRQSDAVRRMIEQRLPVLFEHLVKADKANQALAEQQRHNKFHLTRLHIRSQRC